jgi:hypothetical protein
MLFLDLKVFYDSFESSSGNGKKVTVFLNAMANKVFCKHAPFQEVFFFDLNFSLFWLKTSVAF